MKNNKWAFVAIIAVLAIAAAGAWSYGTSNQMSEVDGDIAANENLTPAAGEENATATSEPALEENVAVEDAAAATDTAKPADIQVSVDASSPTAPRTMGSIDAPVTMVEYSSLTCPHCAHAHETVLPQLIKDYVQTGKLRIVFNDFPLNKEALDASKVSRCVANNQYFNFLTLLFTDIEKWAYTGNHPDALITNATLTGLSAERARECLNDKAIEDALIASVQDAASTHKINSTPTFVFNDGAATIAGAKPYAEFKKTIDDLLAKAGQ